MGSEKEKEDAYKGILSAHKYIQFKLGKRVSLKTTPVIEFEIDERKEFRIEEILKQIKKDED